MSVYLPHTLPHSLITVTVSCFDLTLHYVCFIMIREIMRNGNPPLPREAPKMLQAARCLGAAYDKGGLITPDYVAYTNRILDLVDYL